jgi:hypothetical protein
MRWPLVEEGRTTRVRSSRLGWDWQRPVSRVEKDGPWIGWLSWMASESMLYMYWCFLSFVGEQVVPTDKMTNPGSR